MRAAISQLLQYALMAWCLVKHRDNFTLPLLPVQNKCAWCVRACARALIESN